MLSDVGGRLYGEVDGLLVTCVGPSEITPKGEYSVRPRHLQKKVDIVRDRHEFGESWPFEDGMVGGLEICDLKPDEFRAVII